MKKFMGCAVALMMTVSAMLTGCGQSEDIKDTGAVQVSDSSGDTAVTQNDDGEKITLKFFHNWINVDETPYFEEAEAAFEAEHPNVECFPMRQHRENRRILHPCKSFQK